MSVFDESLKKVIQPSEPISGELPEESEQATPVLNSWPLYTVIYHVLGVAIYSLFLLGSGYMDKHSAVEAFVRCFFWPIFIWFRKDF